MNYPEREGLTDMNPEEYAYVDLNSIIYSNARLLAEWNRKFDKNEHKIKFYEKISNRVLDTIENVGGYLYVFNLFFLSLISRIISSVPCCTDIMERKRRYMVRLRYSYWKTQKLFLC